MKINIKQNKNETYEIIGLTLKSQPTLFNLLEDWLSTDLISHGKYIYDITLLNIKTGSLNYLTIETKADRDINNIYDLKRYLKQHILEEKRYSQKLFEEL